MHQSDAVRTKRQKERVHFSAQPEQKYSDDLRERMIRQKIYKRRISEEKKTPAGGRGEGQTDRIMQRK
jgi:hypothetical protein